MPKHAREDANTNDRGAKRQRKLEDGDDEITEEKSSEWTIKPSKISNEMVNPIRKIVDNLNMKDMAKDKEFLSVSRWFAFL